MKVLPVRLLIAATAIGGLTQLCGCSRSETAPEPVRAVRTLTLDTDNPKFRALMDRMRTLSEAMGREKARGGLLSRARRGLLLAGLATTFARLYLMPVHTGELPRAVRLAPAW